MCFKLKCRFYLYLKLKRSNIRLYRWTVKEYKNETGECWIHNFAIITRIKVSSSNTEVLNKSNKRLALSPLSLCLPPSSGMCHTWQTCTFSVFKNFLQLWARGKPGNTHSPPVSICPPLIGWSGAIAARRQLLILSIKTGTLVSGCPLERGGPVVIEYFLETCSRWMQTYRGIWEDSASGSRELME